MYSAKQRKAAIDTFIRFDHSYADTIAELGYPSRAALRMWWKEYEKTGQLPQQKGSVGKDVPIVCQAMILGLWRAP